MGYEGKRYIENRDGTRSAYRYESGEWTVTIFGKGDVIRKMFELVVIKGGAATAVALMLVYGFGLVGSDIAA